MTPVIDAGDIKFAWARNDLGRHKLLVQIKTTVPPKEAGLPPMIINSGIWVSHENAIALRDALLEQYPFEGTRRG